MVSKAATGIATWLVTTPEGRATLVKAADIAQNTARRAKERSKSNISRPRRQRRTKSRVTKRKPGKR